jgi:hypothetical protein
MVNKGGIPYQVVGSRLGWTLGDCNGGCEMRSDWPSGLFVIKPRHLQGLPHPIQIYLPLSILDSSLSFIWDTHIPLCTGFIILWVHIRIPWRVRSLVTQLEHGDITFSHSCYKRRSWREEAVEKRILFTKKLEALWTSSYHCQQTIKEFLFCAKMLGYSWGRWEKKKKRRDSDLTHGCHCQLTSIVFVQWVLWREVFANSGNSGNFGLQEVDSELRTCCASARHANPVSSFSESLMPATPANQGQSCSFPFAPSCLAHSWCLQDAWTWCVKKPWQTELLGTLSLQFSLEHWNFNYYLYDTFAY